MKKTLKTLLLALLFTSQVVFADAVIFGPGNLAKFLPASGWALSTGEQYRHLAVDPSAGGGVAAPIGSIGVRDNSGGEVWFKFGSPDTSWTNLLTLGGGVSGWGTTGNAGLTAGTNFLGTTDAVDLVLKTGGTERFRITAAGVIDTTLSTGLIHSDSSGLFTSSLGVDADISASAAVTRSKLANGTADHVLINDGSGVMSSEALLAQTRGGTGSGTASGARTNLGLGTIATQDANNVAITGGSITGMSTPSSASDVAIKSYVDAVATALTYKGSVRYATAAALTANYVNGASGVGATLTNAGALAAFSVDGSSPSAGDRILVKNQATGAQNGCYTVTTVGSGVLAWVLTRCTDYDQAAEIAEGNSYYVAEGSTLLETAWVMTTSGAITVGTTALAFAQTIAASQTVTLAGDVSGTGQTGTSITTAIGANKVLDTMIRQGAARSVVGNSTSSTANVADITAGTDGNILRRSGTGIGFGSIDLAAVGAVGSTLLPQANGGTNKNMTPVQGGVVWTDSDSQEVSAAGTSGQIIQSNGTSAPSWKDEAVAKTQSYEVSNCTLTTSVSSNALTISLKTQTGADPSGGSPCLVGVRSTVLTTGAYTTVSITAALSIVLTSGSTLGHLSGVDEKIYVYFMNLAAGVALAVVTNPLVQDYDLSSCTDEGGGGAADTRTTMYCDDAVGNQASRPVSLLGVLYSNEATAGTWAAVPTETIEGRQIVKDGIPIMVRRAVPKVCVANLNCDASSSTIENLDSCVATLGNQSGADCAGTFPAGYWSVAPTCFEQATSNAKIGQATVSSTTAFNFRMGDDDAGAASTGDGVIICVGQ